MLFENRTQNTGKVHVFVIYSQTFFEFTEQANSSVLISYFFEAHESHWAERTFLQRYVLTWIPGVLPFLSKVYSWVTIK